MVVSGPLTSITSQRVNWGTFAATFTRRVKVSDPVLKLFSCVQGSNPFELDSEVSDAIENISDTRFSLEEKLKRQNDEIQNNIEEQVRFKLLQILSLLECRPKYWPGSLAKKAWP